MLIVGLASIGHATDQCKNNIPTVDAYNDYNGFANNVNNGCATGQFCYNGTNGISNAVNCGVGTDSSFVGGALVQDCASGYCGYFSDNSPINISNGLEMIVNDIFTVGAPSYFSLSLHAVVIGLSGTEGAYISINGCPPSTANWSDWSTCHAYTPQGANFTEGGSICEASPNLAKPAIDSNGNIIKGTLQNGNIVDLYCPLLRANVPTSDIKFALDYQQGGGDGQVIHSLDITTGIVTSNGSTASSYDCSVGETCSIGAYTTCLPSSSYCVVSNVGQSLLDVTFLNSSLDKLYVVQEGDVICLMADFHTAFADLKMSCKYAPQPTAASSLSGKLGANSNPSNTFLGSGCLEPSINILSSFSLVGTFMECVDETLRNLFLRTAPISLSNTPLTSQNTNILLSFQEKMRGIVGIMLTLYVIAYGFKIVAGGEMPKKHELFMFAIKIGLVIYFAVGSFSAPPSGTQFASNATDINHNGLTYYFFELFKIMSELANIIIQAGNQTSGTNGNGFCVFPPPGLSYNHGYSYLALWDSLDCHITSYLGLTNLTDGSSKTMHILVMIWIYFVGFQPIMTLYLVFFAFFLISVMINFVLVFLMSMLGLMFIAYLGPIFIPMCLFSYTHKYYEEWLKLAISYTLQPAVMAAGLSLILVVLDSEMYGTCEFAMTSYGSNGHYYAQITADSLSLPGCTNSLGYWVSELQQGSIGSVKNWGGFVSFFIPNIPNPMFKAELLYIAILLFLFYKLADQLAPLASDITGGMDLGAYAAAPSAISDSLTNALKATRGVGRNIISGTIRGGGRGIAALAGRFRKKPVVPPDDAAGGGGGGGGGGGPVAGVAAAGGGGPVVGVAAAGGGAPPPPPPPPPASSKLSAEGKARWERLTGSLVAPETKPLGNQEHGALPPKAPQTKAEVESAAKRGALMDSLQGRIKSEDVDKRVALDLELSKETHTPKPEDHAIWQTPAGEVARPVAPVARSLGTGPRADVAGDSPASRPASDKSIFDTPNTTKPTAAASSVTKAGADDDDNGTGVSRTPPPLPSTPPPAPKEAFGAADAVHGDIFAESSAPAAPAVPIDRKGLFEQPLPKLKRATIKPPAPGKSLFGDDDEKA